MVILMEKYVVRCMRVIDLHAGGRHDCIPNALVIFRSGYCDQTLIFFVLVITYDYHRLPRSLH
jgi:hypothetical protein